MPMETFYRLNPKKMERYQPYLLEMLKKRRDDISESGWANGIYVGRAIAVAFSKGKKYPDEPMRFYQVEEERVPDAERFRTFAIAFNASHKYKEVDKAIMDSLKKESVVTEHGAGQT
jgi:hypothetical protein